MKDYATDLIRNVVLLGHGGSGKTMLAEAMLFNTGATNRLGRVDEGNTVSDYDEEEIRRRISLNLSLIPCEYKGHKINVLDAPGFTDFVGEVRSAVRVADAAMVLVDPVAGVEVGTELVWEAADEYNLPRFVVISKMDRDNANFNRALESVRGAFSGLFVPLFLPIGEQSNFLGVVDLIARKARRGVKGDVADVPADLAGEVESARVQLVEAAAEGDDELIVKYLEGEELTPEEIRRGLKIAIKERKVVPVLVASGAPNLGVIPLMEAILDFLPSPADAGPVTATNPATGEEEQLEPRDDASLAALVFKTLADPFVGKLTLFRVYSGVLASDSRVWNARRNAEERIGQINVLRGKEQLPVPQLHAGDIGTGAKMAETNTGDTLCNRAHPVVLAPPTYPSPLFSVAVEPRTKADSTKMGPTLTRLSEEDPTLRWHQEPSTNQMILEGMGDQHIDVAIRKAESKFGVGLLTSVPKVPYRETITRTFASSYRHKKQTGGAGQFAEVHMRLEPQERGLGYEFASEVVGGAISSNFLPSIDKGVKGVMESGVLANYPVVDVKAVVYDGKMHEVDSKPIAFEIAGREAFKQTFLQAGPVLLEPIMNVTVTVPEGYMGDVLSDLNGRRARVQGMDQQGGRSLVTAQVPLAEMMRYATDLRSLTQGHGIYKMEFSHYEQVPQHVADTIIANAKREREEEKA
jgi:elongation factor G